jgi:hypothetical protein
MRRIKNQWCSVAFVLLAVATAARAEENGNQIEKKKSVIKIYDVTAKDNLLIDNQFGAVKVNLWDKNEIRIDISVTAKAPNDEKAQCYLDGVQIDERKTGDQIILKTNINRDGCSGNWNWSWKGDKADKNFLQIDYVVSMPKNNALTVKNSFGATAIPYFKAPLNVTSKYGSFTATELGNDKTDIDVAFGRADITQMENGTLDISYSTLDLNKAKIIKINNRFGKLRIGEIEQLNGQISYSGGGRIGTLTGSCKIKLDFSSGFKIEQLSQTTDNVDIMAGYSSLTLPVESKDCDFNVTVSYGGFRYPTDKKMSFTQNDDDKSDEHKGPRFTKQYVGKIGRGGDMHIKVVSKFGDVSLK